MKKFKISNDDIEFLRQYLPNIDELAKGSLCDFESELGWVTVQTFVDDEPTDESRMLELIYDRVYMLNK